MWGITTCRKSSSVDDLVEDGGGPVGDVDGGNNCDEGDDGENGNDEDDNTPTPPPTVSPTTFVGDVCSRDNESLDTSLTVFLYKATSNSVSILSSGCLVPPAIALSLCATLARPS